MTEPTNRSPGRAAPTTTGVGDDTEGPRPDSRRAGAAGDLDELTPQTATMHTPDELGGTGGEQAGGAG